MQTVHLFLAVIKQSLLVLLLALIVTSADAAQKLRLFIWSEYLPNTVREKFEKEFECELVVDVYEEAEAMFAKVQGGGASVYDVVVAPDYLMPGFIKLGLAAPLRKGAIPNLKNLEAKFTSPPFDPGNRFSAAYQWGTVGIFARKPAGKEMEHTWGLLLDPKKQPGPFVLIDSMRDAIGAALKFEGRSYNSVNPAELKAARELLLESKRRSSGFAASVAGKNRVLEKAAMAAIVYSGEGARGMSEDPETIYFIPKEGSQIWVDSMMVMARAPEPELAEKFINFVLRPEIGAEISNFTMFTSPNQATRPLIKKELLANPAIYPPKEVLDRLEFLQDLGRDSRLYDQVWMQVKSK